jgi:hypothetical protein
VKETERHRPDLNTFFPHEFITFRMPFLIQFHGFPELIDLFFEDGKPFMR